MVYVVSTQWDCTKLGWNSTRLLLFLKASVIILIVLIGFEKHMWVCFIDDGCILNLNIFGLICIINGVWWVCWRHEWLLFLILRNGTAGRRLLTITLTKLPFILFTFICWHFFGSAHLDGVGVSFGTFIFVNLALVLQLILLVLFNRYHLGHGLLVELTRVVIWAEAIIEKIVLLRSCLINFIFVNYHKWIVLRLLVLAWLIIVFVSLFINRKRHIRHLKLLLTFNLRCFLEFL